MSPWQAFCGMQHCTSKSIMDSLGYVVPQWSAYRLPAFAIAMQHKSLPLFVSMHRWAWDVMSRKASNGHREVVSSILGGGVEGL